MKKLLLLAALLTSLSGFSQELVPVQIETIEIENGLVKYSRDNGTLIIDKETKAFYEIKSPIRFQEGNVYVFYLKPKNCLDCTTIEAELIGHTVAIEQTEKNIAAMRAKIFKETHKE